MTELETSIRTIPLSWWQKVLNIIRRKLGLLVRAEKVVITTVEEKKPKLLK